MRLKAGDRIRHDATGMSYRVTLVGERMIGLEAEHLSRKMVVSVVGTPAFPYSGVLERSAG